MITKTSEAWDTFQKISLKYRDPWDTFQKIREIRLDEALPDWGYVSKDATTTERERAHPLPGPPKEAQRAPLKWRATRRLRDEGRKEWRNAMDTNYAKRQ